MRRISRAEIRSPSTRRVIIGGRLPAHATSAGQILLTQVEESEIDAFLACAPVEQLTPYILVTREQLNGAVELARENGYAFAN